MRVEGTLDVIAIEATCLYLRGQGERPWLIQWPAGFDLAIDGDEIFLAGPGGTPVARLGDRVGVHGALGLFDGDVVQLDLDLGLIKPGLSDADPLKARRAALREWAPKHGLKVDYNFGGARYRSWWSFIITDGHFVYDKIPELETLPEVRSADRNGLGTWCVSYAGYQLTAVAIDYVHPAVASPEPSPSMP